MLNVNAYYWNGMFRGLVKTQPRDEYELLAQKLKEQREAPLPLVDLALSSFVVKWAAHNVDILLDNWLSWNVVPRTHPERSGQLTFLRTTIDGEMQGLRRRVFLMQWARFRRFYCCCKLQAIVLKWLYAMGQDGLPPISRSLVRDGTLLPTGSAEDGIGIGSGDSDGGNVAEDVHADRASPPGPRRGQCRVSLPPLIFN